jgi:ubiquinone/menaquinone biosynthesis C-methylase UbiE
MVRLFASSEIFVPGQPEENGFYDLELPDAFRWIKQEARCLLPAERMTNLASPMFRITATIGRSERFLSVYVDGDFLGTQRIDRYGVYYFHLPSNRVKDSEPVQICLRVDRAEPCAGDPRMLGIAIYGIDVIDLDSGWDGFEERRYLADQVRVFRPTELALSALLEKCGLGPHSLVLDVGAGMGWSTALLAAKTGAKVFGVDLHRYDSYAGDSFRGELLKRLRRHLPVLVQEPGMERFEHPEQVIDACAFFTMDAQHLLFRDGSFDFVFSLNAFEHIPDPRRALQEISRVLKPEGHVFLQFTPIYFSDGGHHLGNLTDIPWIHLLYDRAEIKKTILDAGKVPNEVDNILDSLNGYSVRQYLEIFDKSDLQVLEKHIHKDFSVAGAEQSAEFTKLRSRYTEEDLTTLCVTVVLQKRSAASDSKDDSGPEDSIVVTRPFNFNFQKEPKPVTSGLFRRQHYRNVEKFIVPDWFREHFQLDATASQYWQWQYKLAKENKEYQLPDYRMRMPSDELHQLMAKEFWEKVPKNFNKILDVGCSDGYMIKIFKDSGKDAVGINEFFYPTDRLFIEEHRLEVYEMDMHCMEFDDESFDAVWCRHTLEHSFAPLQVLSEIYRVTKQNGYLFAVLPPPPDPQEPYEGHWHQIPLYQFKYLLEMCNFEILDIRTTYFSYRRENDNLEIRAICKKRAQGA